MKVIYEIKSLCNNETIALYHDKGLTKPYIQPKTNVTIELVNTYVDENHTKQKIVIHTTRVFNKTDLYIGRISRGNVRAHILLSVWIEKRPE